MVTIVLHVVTLNEVLNRKYIFLGKENNYFFLTMSIFAIAISQAIISFNPFLCLVSYLKNIKY